MGGPPGQAGLPPQAPRTSSSAGGSRRSRAVGRRRSRLLALGRLTAALALALVLAAAGVRTLDSTAALALALVLALAGILARVGRRRVLGRALDLGGVGRLGLAAAASRETRNEPAHRRKRQNLTRLNCH